MQTARASAAMLSFSLLSVGCLSHVNPILKYDYGNQIQGSSLTVFDDGSIDHEERTCCPPQSSQITESNLSVNDRGMLINAIKTAGSPKLQLSGHGHLTLFGSMSGSLIVYDGGTAINIKTIKRNSTIGDPDMVITNHSSGARWILRLVESYVKNKMY